MVLTRFAVLATLLLTPVVISPARALAQQLSADEKELASYRLTLPTVKKLAAVMGGFVEEQLKDPKFQELARLQKQIDALESKDELTEAEEAQLEKLRERLEAVEEEAQGPFAAVFNQSKSLTDMEKMLQSHPPAMRVLNREGLAPREFAKAMMALLQASLVEGFSQGKADLSKLPPGVNPENVMFVRQHKAELEAIRASMEASAKK